MNSRHYSILVLLFLAIFFVACGEDEPTCGEGEMVPVEAPVFGISIEMDKYEASRPDASATSEGSASSMACSAAGVMPWTEVSFEQAKDACESAGKRLCTQYEWELACRQLGKNTNYPYGDTYTKESCNGDSDDLLSTGSLSTCVTLQDVVDMSGNVREWVDAEGEALTRMGGAFGSNSIDLGCSVPMRAEGSPGRGDGFRCCKGALSVAP